MQVGSTAPCLLMEGHCSSPPILVKVKLTRGQGYADDHTLVMWDASVLVFPTTPASGEVGLVMFIRAESISSWVSFNSWTIKRRTSTRSFNVARFDPRSRNTRSIIAGNVSLASAPDSEPASSK